MTPIVYECFYLATIVIINILIGCYNGISFGWYHYDESSVLLQISVVLVGDIYCNISVNCKFKNNLHFVQAEGFPLTSQTCTNDYLLFYVRFSTTAQANFSLLSPPLAAHLFFCLLLLRLLSDLGFHICVLKTIISIKPYLLKSNGERLMVQHIVRNGAIVFEKQVIFHEFDFQTSDLKFEVSKSTL